MNPRVVAVAAPLALLLLIVVPPTVASITLHGWLHVLTAWVIVVALPGAVLFPLMYARAKWWTTHLGRAVMMMALGIAGVVILAAVRVLAQWPHLDRTYIGDPINVDLIRGAVYLELLIAIYYKSFALWAVSRRGTDLHTDDAEVRSHTHADHHDDGDVTQHR